MKATSRYRSALDRKHHRKFSQILRRDFDNVITRARRILDGIDAGRKDTH